MPQLLSVASLAVVVIWSLPAQEPDSQQERRGSTRSVIVVFTRFWKRGKSWDLLGQGYQLTADSAVDMEGNVYFSDARKNRILKIDLEGKVSTWKEGSNGTHGVAFGADGRLYGGQHDRKRIVAFASDGAESVVTEGLQTHHFTVTSRNHIYCSDAPNHRIWFVDTAGHKRVVYDGINWPRGLRASADGSALVVNDPPTRWVWLFQIQADGSLIKGRPFYQLETAAGSSDTDAGGMVFDSDGVWSNIHAPRL
jgi:sugar lactone lactonase YvrE